MGISIQQYRAAIGSYYYRKCLVKIISCTTITPDHVLPAFTFLALLTTFLLCKLYCNLRHVAEILCKLLVFDVHPNPGPTDTFTQNQFKICHANVRSIKSPGKLDELYFLATSEKLDVITVSETWLDTSYPSELLYIEGFGMPIRKDRTVGTGGGVAIYVRDNLPCTHRADLESANSECLWVEFRLKYGLVLLGVYYRPPGQYAADRDLFIDELDLSITKALECNPKTLIITGDFNDRCQSWNTDHSDSDLGLRLVNILSQNNLFQLINEPTRVNNVSESLLDLMITDSPGYVLNSGILPPISTSDHSVVFCTFSISHRVDHPFKRKIWDFKKANFEDLNKAALDAPFNTGFDVFDDINDMASFWTDLFSGLCKDFIPCRDILVRPKDKPWVTCKIKQLLRQRNRAWKRFKRFSNKIRPFTYTEFITLERLYMFYKRKRNTAVNALRSSMRSYFSKIRSELDSNDINPKKWWNLSKRFLGSKLNQSIPPLLENGTVISSNAEKCEVFNNYFANQCKLPHEDDPMPLPDFSYRTDARLSEFQIDENDVKKVLQSLKSSSATGPDGIGNLILKNTASGLSPSLTKLFNLSLAVSCFPDSWKISNTCPVFKKNDKQAKSNYRPISLLCNVSKVFERLIFNVLYEYFIRHDLLTRKNSGFKQNDSTINQLLKIVHDIYNGLELQKEARMVFLDISKAFDRVWHEGLLFKLRQLGIEGPLLEFIGSYLSNRFQRVTIGGQSSSLLPVEAGVPQGSILGPLLFLVYINDITDNIECDIKLFADDTSILEIIHDPLTSAGRMNTDLVRISAWGKQWKMTFNAIKSLAILFSTKHNKPDHPPLLLGNSVIPEGTSHTHLGITLSSNLKWDAHITRIVEKARKRLSLLHRLKFRFSRNTLIRLYKSMVRPILEYGCIIFDNCSQTLSDSLESVQYEAARICLGAYKRTPRHLMLKELGWPTLAKRRQYFKLIMFYKIVNGQTPTYLSDLVPNNNGQPTVLLRNRRSQRQIRFNSLRFGNSFFPSTIQLWNDLPDDIRQSATLSQFKSTLKNTLLSVDPVPVYYSHGSRYSNIIHTRLRLGLSGLNSHLHRFNILPSPACKCLNPDESTFHFFLECPYYSVPRKSLLKTVCYILAPGVNPSLVVYLASDILIRYLTHGNNDLSANLNFKVFDAVQKFISDSRRFIF